nr:chitin synthase export chaperone [Quercus suber]
MESISIPQLMPKKRDHLLPRRYLKLHVADCQSFLHHYLHLPKYTPESSRGHVGCLNSSEYCHFGCNIRLRRSYAENILVPFAMVHGDIDESRASPGKAWDDREVESLKAIDEGRLAACLDLASILSAASSEKTFTSRGKLALYMLKEPVRRTLRQPGFPNRFRPLTAIYRHLLAHHPLTRPPPRPYDPTIAFLSLSGFLATTCFPKLDPEQTKRKEGRKEIGQKTLGLQHGFAGFQWDMRKHSTAAMFSGEQKTITSQGKTMQIKCSQWYRSKFTAVGMSKIIPRTCRNTAFSSCDGALMRLKSGRKEITTFFYSYALLTIASLLIDCGVIPPSSGPFPYFVAVQLGLASATCVSLMINGFVGFQLYEDGTTLSVWLLRGCTAAMFIVSFVVSLLTFQNWAGVGPTNTIGLFVVVYIFSAIFLAVYVVMQLLLIMGTLQERWPLWHIGFGIFFFVFGQIILYVLSRTICDKVEHYMDGLFFATLCNLLAVMMVYKYWDSITKEDLEFSVSQRMNNWEVKEFLPEDNGRNTVYQDSDYMQKCSIILARQSHELLFCYLSLAHAVCGTEEPEHTDSAYLDSFQIVDDHVPTDPDPAPSEPPHLTFMRRRHGPLRLSQPVRPTHHHERCRKSRPTILPTADAIQDRRHRIQHRAVLPRHIDGRQRVQFDRALPAGVTLHERAQESDGAAVQRSMVRMTADAVRVERDDGIDGGFGGRRRRRGGDVRAKVLRENGGDVFRIPVRGHGVRQLRVLDENDVLGAAQPQLQRGFAQLVLANVPEPVGVAGRETEDQDGVAQVGLRESEHGGREEHRFVIGMGDEEDDALVGQRREGLGHVRGEDPETEEKDWELPVEQVHGAGGVPTLVMDGSVLLNSCLSSRP